MARDDVDIKIALKGARQAAADAKKVSGGIGGIGRSAQRADKQARGLAGATGLLGRGLKGTAVGLGGATVAAGGLAAVLGVKSVKAFQESRAIALDQAAALKSAGGQAGINQKQLNALATAQSRKTGIDDEAIAQSQTLLLTFQKIRNENGKGNDVYSRASQAVLDLSARFHKGLGPSATMVGKALNDPTKGIAALTRVGVSFSRQQIAQVKHMDATGDRLGAQKLILKELETQTKGSAAAQGTAMDKLAVATGNVEEAIGKGLSPVVDAAAKKMEVLAIGAEPIISKASDAVAKVFARKDLTLGEKIPLAFDVAKADLKPLTEAVRKEVGSLRLDDKLNEAIQKAAPAIVDGLAGAAPHAAVAFARAFANAGPGGQLLTVALLAAKLGAFPAVGRLMAGRTAGSFSRQLPTSIAARQGGMAGKLNTVGAGLGRSLGVVAAGAMVYEIAKGIPALNQYSGKQGWGELWKDVKHVDTGPSAQKDFEKMGFKGRIVPNDAPKNVGARPGIRDSGPSNQRRPAPRFPDITGQNRNSASPGRRKLELSVKAPIQVHIDGKKVAETNARVELRQRERQGG